MPPPADHDRGWSGRLTRLLAGAFAGEANWLSPATDPDTDAELQRAWDGLNDALPTGWVVELPSRQNGAWQLRAYVPCAVATTSLRVREWTAIAQSQLEVLRELTRCLREISGGWVPG